MGLLRFFCNSLGGHVSGRYLQVKPRGGLIALGIGLCLIALRVGGLAVVRSVLASRGALDSNFGVNGRVITDFGGQGGLACVPRVQSDGKIVVLGLTSISGTTGTGLTRYLPDSSPDPS